MFAKGAIPREATKHCLVTGIVKPCDSEARCPRRERRRAAHTYFAASAAKKNEICFWGLFCRRDTYSFTKFWDFFERLNVSNPNTVFRLIDLFTPRDELVQIHVPIHFLDRFISKKSQALCLAEYDFSLALSLAARLRLSRAHSRLSIVSMHARDSQTCSLYLSHSINL